MVILWHRERFKTFMETPGLLIYHLFQTLQIFETTPVFNKLRQISNEAFKTTKIILKHVHNIIQKQENNPQGMKHLLGHSICSIRQAIKNTLFLYILNRWLGGLQFAYELSSTTKLPGLDCYMSVVICQIEHQVAAFKK